MQNDETKIDQSKIVIKLIPRKPPSYANFTKAPCGISISVTPKNLYEDSVKNPISNMLLHPKNHRNRNAKTVLSMTEIKRQAIKHKKLICDSSFKKQNCKNGEPKKYMVSLNKSFEIDNSGVVYKPEPLNKRIMFLNNNKAFLSFFLNLFRKN